MLEIHLCLYFDAKQQGRKVLINLVLKMHKMSCKKFRGLKAKKGYRLSNMLEANI